VRESLKSVCVKESCTVRFIFEPYMKTCKLHAVLKKKVVIYTTQDI